MVHKWSVGEKHVIEHNESMTFLLRTFHISFFQSDLRIDIDLRVGCSVAEQNSHKRNHPT